MKFSKLFLIAVIAITAVTCSRNSDPTSPDSQRLTLNRETDSAIVYLKHNQRTIINNKLTIQFRGVTSDSRCPMDAICVWAGDGEVKFGIATEDESKEIALHTNLEPKLFDFAGYQIVLKNLNQYPKSTETIKPEDYSVELVIKHSNSDSVKSVQLIDGNNNSVVKRDMLNINRVMLDKDILKFETSYSGGCKIHSVELYAYKEIQKSNPAQVTIMLSHDAYNDACEALITRELKFDLSVLKDFLKKTYNIQDKVILLLFDPSGRPLRNPVVEYSF